MLKLGGVVLTLLFFVKGSLSQLDICGVAPLNTRIVGGTNAPEGAWPWQVSLQKNGIHFCGGSLINKEWVMTAAHCFSSTPKAGVLAYLGKQTLVGTNPYQVYKTISKIYSHPSYNKVTNDNDITLLHLNSAVTFTDYIRPVCLPSLGSDFPGGTKCWITGWGNIASGVRLPSPGVLQEAEVPVVDRTTCNNMLGSVKVTENMICAGYTEGGTDTCQGDSGGPMVTKQGSGVWIQAGITSWGYGCALPGSPGKGTTADKEEDSFLFFSSVYLCLWF
ncbi:hypothetical protein KOW79_009517 [Hemibagrus wyckioides]|uniref:Peptidase S1 domain-containing protein n=1 Tax=Hemibagrus wyckioides TaxID=337641 RepID=A0A9D3NP70_9TELE|nr:hypothetical protein KOW79_009517 [Hemibagrus wyckioides]